MLNDEITPAQAVAQFRDNRTELLKVLDKLADEADLLGAAATFQIEKFQSCRSLVRDDQAECGVIGAEGVGKSTLINAILNENSDIVPTSKYDPGTVGPTYIRYRQGDTEYVVVTLDDDGSEVSHCGLSLEDFKNFALQKKNKNNHKRVKSLSVFLDNDLLSGGLTLVDIPGGEGVSAEVRGQTQDFLNNREHAIIGVVRTRSGYGPLQRTLGESDHLSDRIGAFIFNTYDLEADDSLERARIEIEEARTALLEHVIGETQRDIENLRSRTFVTNLRNLARRKTPLNVSEEALMLEGKAALSQIALAIRDRSFSAVMKRAVERTQIVIADFSSNIARRQLVIETLLGGEKGVADLQAARDALSHASRVALKLWHEAPSKPGMIDEKESCAERIRVVTLQVVGQINVNLSSLSVQWQELASQSEIDLIELQNNVEKIFSDAQRDLESVWEETLQLVARSSILRRNELYSDALQSLDLFAGTQAATSSLESGGGFSVSLKADRGEDVASAAALASTLAVAAGGLAATGAGAVIALIPAAGAIAVGGYAAVRHFARGGDRGAGLRLLKEAHDAGVGALPTPMAAKSEWLQKATNIDEANRSVLVKQLEELKNLLEAPVDHKDELQNLSDELNATQRRVQRYSLSVASLA